MNSNKRFIKKIEDRIEGAKSKYGDTIPLNGEKFRDNFKEAIEEALDLSVYLAVCTFETQEYLERYKIAYNLLMEYWDILPDEDKPELHKKLEKLGL